MSGQGKGMLLVNLRGFVEAHEGAARWRSLVDGLQPADREVIDGMVLTGGWYPVGVWNRVVASYLFGHPDPGKHMTALARHIADKDLNTLFKVILRMGSPAFVLGRTDSLWQRYFDVGKMTHREVAERNWHLTLAAPTAENEGPSEWTCGPGVSGWLTQALELTGAKTGRVAHTRCRFHGAIACEYEARW